MYDSFKWYLFWTYPCSRGFLFFYFSVKCEPAFSLHYQREERNPLWPGYLKLRVPQLSFFLTKCLLFSRLRPSKCAWMTRPITKRELWCLKGFLYHANGRKRKTTSTHSNTTVSLYAILRSLASELNILTSLIIHLHGPRVPKMGFSGSQISKPI